MSSLPLDWGVAPLYSQRYMLQRSKTLQQAPSLQEPSLPLRHVHVYTSMESSLRASCGYS